MAETLDQLDPKVIILFTPKRRLQHLPPKGRCLENRHTEERDQGKWSESLLLTGQCFEWINAKGEKPVSQSINPLVVKWLQELDATTNVLKDSFSSIHVILVETAHTRKGKSLKCFSFTAREMWTRESGCFFYVKYLVSDVSPKMKTYSKEIEL